MKKTIIWTGPEGLRVYRRTLEGTFVDIVLVMRVSCETDGSEPIVEEIDVARSSALHQTQKIERDPDSWVCSIIRRRVRELQEMVLRYHSKWNSARHRYNRWVDIAGQFGIQRRGGS